MQQRRQRATAQGLLAVSRRVKQERARLRCEELGGRFGHGGVRRKASRKPTQNNWTGQPFWT